MWKHLPRHLTTETNGYLPPRYHLCIPFPDDEQLFLSACNIPWKRLGPVPASARHPQILEGNPDACASHIATFFVAMLKESELACFLQLEYCVAANTSDLRRVPVLAFRDNGYNDENAEQMRRKVDRVLERYLFPKGLWVKRKSVWMLAYEEVFEEDGEIAPHRCPGCSDDPGERLCDYPRP